jgi:hypothetical protein
VPRRVPFGHRLRIYAKTVEGEIEKGHGVWIRRSWPASISRSSDGVNFTHPFEVPGDGVRDVAFGLVAR